MNRYSRRTLPSINLKSELADELERALEKAAVEPMPTSIYEQITSIMGNSKSKYSTVAAAVEDLKKRTGLSNYLNETIAAEKTTKKAGLDIERAKVFCDGCQKDDKDCKCSADCQCSVHCLLKKKNKIKLFELVPQIKQTIDNYLEDTRGNYPLPAILQKIKEIHKSEVLNDGDWHDPDFLKYVNNKNKEIKAKYPSQDENHSNLGKIPSYSNSDIDQANNSLFNSLNPNSNK